MTEDEAKTKWCPFARCGSSCSGLGAFNRDALPSKDRAGVLPTESLCIGSACMAWRVRHMSPEQRAAMHRDEGRLHPELSSDQLWSRVNACDVGDGFCGLAGAPQ